MLTAAPRVPRVSHFMLAGFVGAGVLPAQAQDWMSQDFIPHGQESVVLELGGIVNRFDTSLRFDGSTRNGTDFKLEDNGLNNSLSSFDAALTWRFAHRHRLDLEYYSANRSGSRTYTREIDVGDTTFPIGAKVDLNAKDAFFNVDYRYSFTQSPEFEFAGLVGIYGGQFKFDLDAVGAAGTSGTVTQEYHKTTSTTVPLPLLGVSFDWYPDRRWSVTGLLRGMSAKIGDVDGHVYVATLSTDYMFTRSLGLGARYTYTDIKADVTKSDFNGNFGWKTNSVSLYGRFLF